MRNPVIVTETDLATFTRRSHELYRRMAEGALPVGAVLIGLQELIEGRFPNIGRPATTLPEMIRAGHYDWTNPDINEEKFTVDPRRFTTEGTKVYHFNKWMSIEAVIAEMMKDGYEPAFIENLLAYGAENPEEQRKYPIVALGSSCVSRDGDVVSPFLDRRVDGRGLDLDWLAGDWSESCRFLAARKSAL